MDLLIRLWREEGGQGMAEYGLILALVAVLAIAGFKVLGTNIKEQVNTVGGYIADPNSAPSN